MSHQGHKSAVANLERLNSELTQSLERCRFLLSECRSKLAANANEDVDEEGERATTPKGG